MRKPLFNYQTSPLASVALTLLSNLVNLIFDIFDLFGHLHITDAPTYENGGIVYGIIEQRRLFNRATTLRGVNTNYFAIEYFS